MGVRTIDDVIAGLPRVLYPRLQAPKPPTNPEENIRLGLAVEEMKRHTTDEGWQLYVGLESTGYRLAGYNITLSDPTYYAHNLTDCRMVRGIKPSTVILQDKREWDAAPGNFRGQAARFQHVGALRDSGSFNLTILKDSHQRQDYHRMSAEEIGCHAWIIYYHPRIVFHLAPYVRPEHLIRTTHSIDPAVIPEYRSRDRGCLLSGAVSAAYPLRQRLIRDARLLPETDYLPHPGYHCKGPDNPRFMETLSLYRVAICTSSCYGYSLRKLVEATACGCSVITDLPVDDVLPEIDGNLYRVQSSASVAEVEQLVRRLIAEYDPERQAYYAQITQAHYGYRAVGHRLAGEIAALRSRYAV